MNNNINNGSLIQLHDDEWITRQRIAGECVAYCLQTAKDLIEQENPNLTLKQIEKVCEALIDIRKCTPTFFNYRGFPGKICASKNEEIVHGIPDDLPLEVGDVVKIDLGATFEGTIADAAITAIYGKSKSNSHVEMLKVCQNALYEGIKQIKIGKQVGCIGNAISKYVSSRSNFKLITQYGGHGLNYNIPHAEPFIANKAKPNEGVRIQAGMSIAIEPMLVDGPNNETKVDKDAWTVIGSGISAHFEHTIMITKEGVEIMTHREEETLPRLLKFENK